MHPARRRLTFLSAALAATAGAYFVATVTSGHPQAWWPYFILLGLAGLGALGFPTISITGGAILATTDTYNTRGWLAATATGGQQWTSTYDLLGQVTGTTSPNAGATTLSYDNSGNLTHATDQLSHAITWTYDALNRKTGEYDGSSSTAPPIATWTYDNSNNVSGVTDPVGQLTTENAYDQNGDDFTFQQKGFNAFGESLGETVTVPADQGALAGSYTLSHTYSTTAGLPARDTYPQSPGGGSLPAETSPTPTSPDSTCPTA